MKSISEEEKGSEVKAQAFRLLLRLAINDDNKPKLFATPGLVEEAIKSIKEEEKGSKMKVRAFGLLLGLAANDDNKPRLFATPGVVEEAMKSIKEEVKGSEVKAEAFGLLWNLAVNDDNRPKLFATPGLVEEAMKSIKEEKKGSQVKANAFQLLLSLTMNVDNRPKLFATPGLVEETIRCIKEEETGSEVKANAFDLLSNLALDEGNRFNLFAAPGLIKEAMKSIKEEEETESEVKANALGLLWNLSDSDTVVLPLFETPGFPELLIEMLEFEALGTHNFEGALSITGNLSFTSPLRSKLLAMKVDDIIARRVLVTTEEKYHQMRVDAVMTLAIMYSNDEEKSKRLQWEGLAFHSMMEDLLGKLEGRYSGGRNLRDILVPLATLSRLPSNRRYFEEKEGLLSILIDKALPRFLLSTPPDPFLFDVAISILSQYSLDEDKTYLRRFQSDVKLRDLLSRAREKCLSSSLWASNLPQIDGLLWSLNEEAEKRVKHTPATMLDPAGDLQVMVSYNWKSSKNEAKAVEAFLASKGIKTWIDEKMMRENPMAAMAEAVESSSIVIALLTDGYFESANCQRELSYAAKLERKIIPLINQRDFKPRGWLGLLISTILYYDISNPTTMSNILGDVVDKEISPFGKRRTTVVGTSRPTPLAVAAKPLPKQLSVEEVADWVKALALTTDLHEKFKEEEISGDGLLAMQRMTMDELETYFIRHGFGVKSGKLLAFKKKLDDLFA